MAGRVGGMSTDLDDRVRALERAVSERDDPPEGLPAIADVTAATTDLDDRVSDLESRVADLVARQQAVEAYVDRVDHVNESIERRADAALAAIDRLESRRACDPATTDSSEPHPSTGSDSAERPADPDSEVRHSSHVTDAASVTGRPDDEVDSGVDGLLARLVGL